jgi:hypothetical protein
MRRLTVWLVAMAAACGGGSDGPAHHDAAVHDGTVADTAMHDAAVGDAKPDSSVQPDATVVVDATVTPDAQGVCNPLAQTGCAVGQKCTWLLDALTPQYVGHIGCAPDGTANAGDACMYGAPGATGYDGCKKGTVCGNYRGGTGVCKPICDNQGGAPACDAQHVCVTYSGLFTYGSMQVAGVCDTACNPLDDNDFDGSGALTRTGTTCGSAEVGCYGYPSFGTPPVTGWSCTNDIHAQVAQPAGLRHRVQCLDTNGCADPGPVLYVNSCNQGYLPLLRESQNVTTVICVAMCKPHNCYAGSCGAGDVDRLGVAPHRCNTTDALGTFDTTAGGEHCMFSWFFEDDGQGNFLRSSTSDTLGFCFDHSKYLYDSNADGTPDTPYPPCASLPNGFGTNGNLGAADVGCVDTANAGLMFLGKPHKKLDLRPMYRATRSL